MLFLNPSQVWLQPPGYITQMFSRNHQPQLLRCEVTAPRDTLDVNAKRSSDGKTLALQAVNPTDKPIPTRITLAGFAPSSPSALATELAAPLAGRNTSIEPSAAVPKTRQWQHGLNDQSSRYTFLPHSVTVLRFE